MVQDGGLGQFRYYANVDNGTTPPVPTTKDTISPTGTLSPPRGWKAKVSGSGANKRLWILVGRGRPSGTVTWAGVYKVGEKGEKGDTGNKGDDGTPGVDAVGQTGLRGTDGTVGTDGLSQMRFYYSVNELVYELVVPISRGQIDSNGLLTTPPFVRVKNLFDNTIDNLSDRWSTSVPHKVLGDALYTLVGYGKPSTTITWAGIYKAEGQDGVRGVDGLSADGSVTTDKLADDAVTEDKIADDAVTSAKIAGGAIIQYKIGTAAVTEDKLDDNSVTNRKLDRHQVSMLERYKDPVFNPNTILQETGNVVYHLRFYGRINADFDGKDGKSER